MIPSVWASVQDWMRLVAKEVNPVLQGYPFPMLDSAPSDVGEGYTYYDLGLHKVRTWNGSAFQNHW